MILFANAKINLGLQIRRKREDGFHEIASLMYPIPYEDALEILPSEQFELVLLGAEIEGDMELNLITRAYRIMEKNHSIGPVKIILQKNIAMGAGLGGGSADASFTLMGLNNFFSLNLDIQTLKNYASTLGSDCPFFIENAPQLARGRGELLEGFDLNLKGYYLKLICPNIHLSTADAYAGVHPKESLFDWAKLKELDWAFWKENLVNDFERHLFKSYPVLDQIKKELYADGALYASMSGSGSSMYGIFKTQPDKEMGNEHVVRVLSL
jgi:4-diphosphocytidyl-2-C-methyl-D-erythritol kinase